MRAQALDAPKKMSNSLITKLLDLVFVNSLYTLKILLESIFTQAHMDLGNMLLVFEDRARENRTRART